MNKLINHMFRMREDGLSDLKYQLLSKTKEYLYTNVTVKISRPKYLVDLEAQEERKAELARQRKMKKTKTTSSSTTKTTTTTTTTTNHTIISLLNETESFEQKVLIKNGTT